MEPFEIVYRFDGEKIYRVLHSLETGERIEQEGEWQEITNMPVVTDDEEVQALERIEAENQTTNLEKEMQTAKETGVEPQEHKQQGEEVAEEKSTASDNVQEDRRKQMKALEESIQLELEREPLIDTDKQYVEHLKQTDSMLRDLLKQTNNPEIEKKIIDEAKEGVASVKRTSRRKRRALSYREQSSEDNLEEEVMSTPTPRIISDKKVKKKLKVTLQRVSFPLESKTFTFGDNSPSLILAARELEGVMQSSSLQVMPKQILEDDSPSGESSKAAG